MQGNIQQLLDAALAEIGAADNTSDLENIKVKYLGHKSELSTLLKALKDLPLTERPQMGQQINLAKQKISDQLDEKRQIIVSQANQAAFLREKLDVSFPARGVPRGHRHPVTIVIEEIKNIFKSMGFVVAEGPDIETEFNNFEALNIPPFHPSRDMHDTFYLKNGDLLRTHTSPVQIRYMQNYRPPFAIIAPGRVYRKDSDVTHSPVFHQVEGLWVDKGVTFAHLKGALTHFLREVFGKERNVRFRPSYFPFTEPSAEVDVECILCGGSGCRLCKETGWLEILGAGMVDPNVFLAVKYNPNAVSGFAFGIGIERVAMLKYGIDDIRLFFENRQQFLHQF